MPPRIEEMNTRLMKAREKMRRISAIVALLPLAIDLKARNNATLGLLGTASYSCHSKVRPLQDVGMGERPAAQSHIVGSFS